jgi:hypothetical protein
MVLNHFFMALLLMAKKFLPLSPAPSFHRVACVCVKNFSLWWQCSNNYIYCSKKTKPPKTKPLKTTKSPEKNQPLKKKSKKPKGGEKPKKPKGEKNQNEQYI